MKIPTLPLKSARTQGFTLIELLVVISIIAILAGFAMPVFTSAQKRGRLTDSLSNCKQVTLALRMFAGENESLYPNAAVATGSAAGTALAAGDYSNKAFENLMPKYTTSKTIFINKASAYCKNPATDNGVTDANKLLKGQNDWLYVLGLSDTSDSRWPLIATATKSASDLTYDSITTNKGGVWGGTDAIIGFCDGSVKQISGKDMDSSTPNATFAKQPIDKKSNILTATAEWLGTETKILVPES